MQPGRYTELFFLDEATAFAAGHRPCALCRREDYVRFLDLWTRLYPGEANADAMDARLHRERLVPETRLQRRHEAPYADLPGGSIRRRSRGGAPRARRLRAGWRPVVPLLHPTAMKAASAVG